VNGGARVDGFKDAVVVKPTAEDSIPVDSTSPKLGVSRSYSLALAPQLIYTESKLLPYLVSSKVYRQLEFLAMGSWWLYTLESPPGQSAGESPDSSTGTNKGHLTRIPTTREDVVFSDKSIDLRSKRAVMKVLRFIMDYENQPELWESYSSKPFPDLLSGQFKLPPTLHNLFLALALSPNTPQTTTTSFALPRIARHLRSTGKLGAGFSSVIPKWGGFSEIAQVACRACAVGGGVYVLGKGIQDVELIPDDTVKASSGVIAAANSSTAKTVKLAGGETITTSWNIGMPLPQVDSSSSLSTGSRSIFIISSPLISLFPRLSEGAPLPAGAAVVFPTGSIQHDATSATDTPPVYLIIHSSDTGECPTGQCTFRFLPQYSPSLSRMMNTPFEYLSTLSVTSTEVLMNTSSDKLNAKHLQILLFRPSYFAQRFANPLGLQVSFMLLHLVPKTSTRLR
jgi:hypothetical protein